MHRLRKFTTVLDFETEEKILEGSVHELLRYIVFTPVWHGAFIFIDKPVELFSAK